MNFAAPSADARVGRYDWDKLRGDLDARGAAVLEAILSPAECAEVAALYAEEARFRSHIVMARHGFGKGEYRYFAYPLPELVESLRTALYARLAPLATAWSQRQGAGRRFPDSHADYLRLCHDAGQTRPTPLLLQYGPEDYNALHQDLYGELVFPLQVAILLSQPERDFTGGEFVLVEQRPRMQSRAEVISLQQGDAVVFAVRERPVRGAKGFYRTQMRHGVSRIRTGARHTLGLIFHDAK